MLQVKDLFTTNHFSGNHSLFFHNKTTFLGSNMSSNTNGNPSVVIEDVIEDIIEDDNDEITTFTSDNDSFSNFLE